MSAANDTPPPEIGAARYVSDDEIVPDEHGNRYITFSDGTGAVHTKDGWIMVVEDA